MKDIKTKLRKLASERKNRPMRRIVQKSGTSCGVACVAMLARIDFKNAMRLGVACYDRDYWPAVTLLKTSTCESSRKQLAKNWGERLFVMTGRTCTRIARCHPMEPQH